LAQGPALKDLLRTNRQRQARSLGPKHAAQQCVESRIEDFVSH
jgi:hypothetical protein